MVAATSTHDRGASLTADCARCVGLCCVALAFARSRDFGLSKDAGDPCRNLTDDYRCDIHPSLRSDGFKGCTVFDCHGAGQKVTQVVFAGRSWRDDDVTRAAMFAVFPIVRELHEMLWYLQIVSLLADDVPLLEKADSIYERIRQVSESDSDRLLELDVDAVRGEVNAVLGEASIAIRSAALATRTSPLPSRFRPGADLVGAGLGEWDLRGAELRGSLLLAADLSNADLRGADLLGADLRDADLSGADLSTAAFVTQMQLNAATGDAATSLPVAVLRPSHWG